MCCIIMINANPLYHTLGTGAVGVTIMLFLVVPRAVTVTACDTIFSCGVVTVTAPLCLVFSV